MKRNILKFLALSTISLTLIFISLFSANAAISGDVTGDDKNITAADARIILRASVMLDKLTDEQSAIADVNEDGRTNAADARLVLRMSVGLEEISHYKTKTELVAPTCTTGGTYLRVCTECDEQYEETGKPLGHTYPNPEVITEVTCETDGLVKYTCSVCGESKEEVVAHGHIWDPEKATCTEAQYCIRGNHIGTPALGHTTEWGKCTRCNKIFYEKYAKQGAIIKEKIPVAIKKSEEAYAIINKSVGAAGWLKDYAKQAKPVYQASRDAYQAAYDACGEIAEFSAIKANLNKAIKNTDKILNQIDKILATSKVTDANYNDLTGGIDTPQWANESLNKKLTKAVVW